MSHVLCTVLQWLAGLCQALDTASCDINIFVLTFVFFFNVLTMTMQTSHADGPSYAQQICRQGCQIGKSVVLGLSLPVAETVFANAIQTIVFLVLFSVWSI